MTEILILVAATAGFAFAAWLTGHFALLRIEPSYAAENGAFPETKMAVGAALITVLYGAAVANMLTILLPVLLLAGYGIYRNKNNQKTSKPVKFSISETALPIAGICISIGLSCAILAYCDNYPHIKLDQDSYFYANLASFFQKYHVESTVINQFVEYGDYATAPYHYYDLWATGLVNFISHVSPVKSLVLSVYPFYSYLAISILYRWVSGGHIHLQTTIFIVLVCSLTFTPSIFLNRFDIWFYKFSKFYIYMYHSKVVCHAPFVILFLQILRKNYTYFSSLLAVLIFFISPLIGITFFGAFILYEFSKILLFRRIKTELIYLISSVVFFGVFYFLFSGKTSEVLVIPKLNLYFFKEVFFSTLGYMVVSLPVALLILVVEIFRKQSFVWIWLLICCLAAGCLYWFFEGRQLLSNFISMLFSISTAAILISIYRKSAALILALVIMILCYQVYISKSSGYTADPRMKLADVIPYDSLSHIGLESTDSLFRKSNPFFLFTYTKPALFPVYDKKFYWSASPGMIYTGYSKDSSIAALQKLRQMQDMMYHHARHYGLTNVEQATISFIRKHGVNHIYQQSGQPIPSYIRNKVRKRYRVNALGDSLFLFQTPAVEE